MHFPRPAVTAALALPLALSACKSAPPPGELMKRLEQVVNVLNPGSSQAPGPSPGAREPSGTSQPANAERPVDAGPLVRETSLRTTSSGARFYVVHADGLSLPGLPPDRQAGAETSAQMADDGVVALLISSRTPGRSLWSGLWRQDERRQERVAATGDPTPGLKTSFLRKVVGGDPVSTPRTAGELSFIQGYGIGPGGALAFDCGTVHGETTTKGASQPALGPHAMWIARPDETELVAVGAGEWNLDVPATVLRDADGMVMLADGGLLVWSAGGRKLSVVTDRGLRTLAQAGETAPGMPAAVRVEMIGALGPPRADLVVLGLTLSGPGLADKSRRSRCFIADSDGIRRFEDVAQPVASRAGVLTCFSDATWCGADGSMPTRTLRSGSTPMKPFTLPKSCHVLADGRVIVVQNGLWIGSPEQLERVDVDRHLGGKGANPFDTTVCANGTYGFVTGLENDVRHRLVRSVDGELQVVLTGGDSLELTDGDRRKIEELRLHGVGAAGELLVQVKFAAEFGVRDASRGWLVVLGK